MARWSSRRSLVGIGLLALSMAAPAAAQEPARDAPTKDAPAKDAVAAGAPAAVKPAPAKPATAPVPPTPTATEPTPDHIAKARHLILATGISRSFQIIIPEAMDEIGNSLAQSRPDLVHDMNIVMAQLRPEFEHQSDEMIDLSARIYAGLLSEKDIDAVLAFYDSEAGKHYVGAQPLFLNQLVSGMQAWQRKIVNNMELRVRQEMKKKGHVL